METCPYCTSGLDDMMGGIGGYGSNSHDDPMYGVALGVLFCIIIVTGLAQYIAATIFMVSSGAETEALILPWKAIWGLGILPLGWLAWRYVTDQDQFFQFDLLFPLLGAPSMVLIYQFFQVFLV